MHVKTMEGLIGARVNMNLTREPMRVFREASRKDDFATMERAMGYVNEYEDRAFEYKKTADDGMEKEAEENREKEKLAREEAIKKRREERKAQEEKLAAERQENCIPVAVRLGSRNTDKQTVSHYFSGIVDDIRNLPVQRAADAFIRNFFQQLT